MKKQGFLAAAAFILSAFCSISPYKAIAAGALESYDIGADCFRYADMSDTDWGKPAAIRLY